MSHTEELDTIPETMAGRLGQREVLEETREIFNSFMAISEAFEAPGRLDRDPSFDLGLEFSTEIESDGIGQSSQESSSSHDSVTNGDVGDEEYKKVGLALQLIGDDINDNFIKKNADIEKALQNLGATLLTQAAENVFQETIDNILTEFTGSFPNQEEKYKVALVMLCTRRSIFAINSALNVTKDTRDIVIGSAMSYIAGHYPGWITNFST